MEVQQVARFDALAIDVWDLPEGYDLLSRHRSPADLLWPGQESGHLAMAISEDQVENALAYLDGSGGDELVARKYVVKLYQGFAKGLGVNEDGVIVVEGESDVLHRIEPPD